MNLPGIPPAVAVRHAGGGGEKPNVVVEGLAGVADGDRAVEKDVGGFFAHADQLLDGELLENAIVHRVNITADQPRVGHAHPRHRLAGRVMNDLDFIHRLVRLAVAQDRNMQHDSLTSGAKGTLILAMAILGSSSWNGPTQTRKEKSR